MYKSGFGNKKEIKKLEMLKYTKQVSQLFKSVTWLPKVHLLASLLMLQTDFPVFRSLYMLPKYIKSSSSCLTVLAKSFSDNSEQSAAIVIGDGLYWARADHYLQQNNYL